jgi:hypothetical protein
MQHPFFPTVVPHIFPPGVPQVESSLATVYLSVFRKSFEGRFMVTPSDAVEGIVLPFFLVNDVIVHFPIREV